MSLLGGSTQTLQLCGSRAGTLERSSSSSTTAHYARPTHHASLRSLANGIQYPTICPEPQPSTTNGSQQPYASVQKPNHFSSSQLQLEHVRARAKMLEAENRRLMASQGQLVADANRRVEMHINEIRSLKEELKKIELQNKELRDLCCFLDDDRQKTRRLGREWQKFGRYTSEVMKQEVHAYQCKLRDMERRQHILLAENEELKQLCLYLDEQRQALLAARQQDEHSEDLGCGSSERSTDSDQLKPEVEQTQGYCQEKEQTLRMITASMQTSLVEESGTSDKATSSTNDRLLDYIQALEGRIKHLEMAQSQQDAFWHSSSNLASESEEKTIIEREWSDDAPYGEEMVKKELPDRMRNMNESTSTMTSSGTTYGSSETDESAAVFVMGDELDAVTSQLEVRTLPPIDEEEDSAALPPKMAPISLSVGRLCNKDETPDDVEKETIGKKADDQSGRPASVGAHRDAVINDSLAEAVKVLRVHETAARNGQRALTRQETAIVQKMCQLAWDSLDRKSRALTRDEDPMKAQISAV